MSDIYISRQPLVNRQSKIIATRLTLHLDGGATTQDAANTLSALTEYWPQGEKLVFINCGNISCDSALLDWPAPENVTLEVHSASLLDPSAGDFLAALQSAHPSLCLVHDVQAQAALAKGVNFRFIAFDAQHSTPRSCGLWRQRCSLSASPWRLTFMTVRVSRPASTPA